VQDRLGSTRVYDNRRLAPLFGLSPDISYGIKAGKSTFVVLPAQSGSILWRGVEFPYASEGLASTQVPSEDLSWFGKDGKLIGARPGVEVLARTETGSGVVLSYLTRRYSALYISHMPDYGPIAGSPTDAQFVYNCADFLYNQSRTQSLVAACKARLAQKDVRLDNFAADSLPADLADELREIVPRLVPNQIREADVSRNEVPNQIREADVSRNEVPNQSWLCRIWGRLVTRFKSHPRMGTSA
jgi:hypothetical protein